MRHRVTGEMVYHLARLDLDQVGSQPDTIALTFLAHGITPSPHQPNLYLLFEKHGPGCCAVDLERGEVTKSIPASAPSREFYGHGTFTADGSAMLCTETDVQDRRKGYIAIRDPHTFEYLGDMPSFGLAPHDCMWTADGSTLVVANGGGAVGDGDGPCITYLDVKAQRLLERVDVPDPNLNAGHLAMSSGDDLALVSAPRDGLDPRQHRGGLSVRPAGGALRSVNEPAEVMAMWKGETLSVAIHEPTRTVGATNPLGLVVAFWNLDTGEPRKHLRVPNPRGLALSLHGDEFILNFGDPPRTARIDAKTLTPVDAPGNQRGYLSMATGSHIMMI